MNTYRILFYFRMELTMYAPERGNPFHTDSFQKKSVNAVGSFEMLVVFWSN